MKFAQSHARQVTSRQPCTRSAKKLCRSARSDGDPGRSRIRKTALATKLAASIANAQPEPTPTTSSPATAGPKTNVALWDRLISAFACCRRPRLVISGISPVEAGPKNAAAPPTTADATMSIQSWSVPAISPTATNAWAAARRPSQTSMTPRRGRRSAHTPPTRTKSTRATVNEASTSPRSPADPSRSDSTAKASATGTSASPIRRGLAEPEQAEGTFLERAEPSLQREHPRKIYARAVEIHPGAVVTAVSRNPTHALGKPNRERIRLLTGLGVDGDAHMGATVKHRSRVARDPTQPNLRQVHLIHAELHDELRAAGFELAAGQMGENVTTRGIHLLRLPAGSRLHLGGEAVVEVTGLRNPCKQLEGIQSGLMAATLDRGEHGRLVRKAGVMSVVLAGGEVKPGDPIGVVLPPGSHRPLEPV